MPDHMLHPNAGGRGLVGTVAWWAMVIVMGAGTLLAAGTYLAREHTRQRDIDRTIASLQRIQRELQVRAGMEDTELNVRGWPVSVEPSWFGDSVPQNHAASRDRPWLEIAPDAAFDRKDPDVLIAEGRGVAAFWYNPGTGVVRARVGMRATDAATLETYNAVNRRHVERLIRAPRRGE